MRILALIVCLMFVSGCEGQYRTENNNSEVGRYRLVNLKKPYWIPSRTEKGMVILEEMDSLLKIDTITGRVWAWYQRELENSSMGYWDELTKYDITLPLDKD